MRATTALGSLTASSALVVAALVVTAPTASAAAPDDWRVDACTSGPVDLHATGHYAVEESVTESVPGVPSLTVTAERLAFTNGARCDLFHLDGRLPFRQELRAMRSSMTTRGVLVVGGASQGEVPRITTAQGLSGDVSIREVDRQVLGGVVYRDVESGTMGDSADVPEPWRDQPYTVTHARTTFSLKLRGRVGTRKTFTVTPATRAAAERRLERDLARAAYAIDRRAARRTYRLALRGVRLEMSPFVARWSGELPR